MDDQAHPTDGDGEARVERVLAEDYLDGLMELPLGSVRELRGRAEQEETDLSFLRRMIQGWADILLAELQGRGETPGDNAVPKDLAHILADETRAPSRGRSRHLGVDPAGGGAHRRRVEALVAELDLSGLDTRSDEELRQALDTLIGEERAASRRRRAVQQVMDACSAEITRRYRDGEADVTDLLSEQSGTR